MNWEKYLSLGYNKYLKANAKILDMIDLSKYFEKGCTIKDIADNLQYDYMASEIVNNSVCKGFILNHFDEYDFMEYLRHRYPNLKIQEEITVQYRVVDL